MSVTVAWLASGKLRLKSGDAPPRTVESRFANEIRERAVKAHQRHAWKGGDAASNFLSGPRLWGRANFDPTAVRVAITSFCRGAANGQVLYSLEKDHMCAILALENLGEEERRLWHKNDKRLGYLNVSPSGAVACSLLHPIGTANIAVRIDEESGFSEVTEGDSVDAAPRWVPGERRRLVFQSAGVGRNQAGHYAGLGPFAVQLLDIDSSDLTTVVEDAQHDCLTPQMLDDGTLYYIRRPYEPGQPLRPLRVLKDVVLLPFRLLYVLFGFLQALSVIFTGKKLTTAADGPPGREMDMKEMWIWGSVVSAQNAKGADAEGGLVPDSWQLIRRTADGQENVIAKGVLAYDLAPDGSIVFTNGSAIYMIDAAGKRTRLARETMVQQVAVVSAPANCVSGAATTGA